VSSFVVPRGRSTVSDSIVSIVSVAYVAGTRFTSWTTFALSSDGLVVFVRPRVSFPSVVAVVAGAANEGGARLRRVPIACPVRLGNAHGATVVIIGLFEPGVPIFPRGASALRSAEARPATPPGRPSGAAGAAAVLSRSPTASSPSPGAVGSDISALLSMWRRALKPRRVRRTNNVELGENQRRTTKTPRVVNREKRGERAAAALLRFFPSEANLVSRRRPPTVRRALLAS
jgi:hypothetical protein